MTNSDLQNNIVETFTDLFSMLNIENKFMCEVPESSLNSVAPYNILVGIGGDYEGNFMFGYTEKTALNIFAALVESENTKSVDKSVISALADIFADFTQRILYKTHPQGNLSMSSPAYICGKDLQAMISKVPAINLFFKTAGEKFNVSYYLEKI